MKHLFLLLTVLIAPLAHALETQAVGDGGSVAVVFENRGVHPQTARVEAGGDGVEADIPPFGKVAILVQCLGTPPALLGGNGEANTPITLTSLSFPEGPPALWISREKSGRATLEAHLREVRPGLVLQHIALDQVPDHFAALRFAPLILMEISDWGDLSPERRTAIRGAVAAGAVLLLGGGEGPVEPSVIEQLLPVRSAGVERAGPALTAAVQRASGHRILTAEPAVQVRVEADRAPVVVEAPLGLGLVRVVSVRLSELDHGPVENAAFAEAPDALGTVLSWLQGVSPLGEARTAPLAVHTWYLLLALVGLALIARRFPKVAVGGGLVLATVALALPPTQDRISARAARLLYIPAGAGALAVGTLDLELHRGGAHTIAAGSGEISLDEAQPSGGCALMAPGQAAWTVTGEPGARRRLTVFALVDQLPAAGAAADPLPAWPAGPLAEGALAEAVNPLLPMALAPAVLEARVVTRPTPQATPPTVLPSPPEGG